ncbi:unnamed protein product [Sphacelaria rigidula]
MSNVRRIDECSQLRCRLVLMADEVYQENIYQSRTPFVSCKKVKTGDILK